MTPRQHPVLEHVLRTSDLPRRLGGKHHELVCLTILLLAIFPVAASAAGMSDASTGGNPYFHWLAPLVKNASFSGEFDADLAPEVHVCLYDTANAECLQTLDVYTTERGPGDTVPETVRLDEEGQHFIVNWDTRAYGDQVGSGSVFRVSVRVGLLVLGYADVVSVQNGKELKSVDSEEYFGLVDGRTLPIKFRIEVGALLEGNDSTYSVGHDHACRIDFDGAAFCFGGNRHGQLGTGEIGPHSNTEPVPVIGGHRFMAISAGRYHTCAVTAPESSDPGAVYCWGLNISGQVGAGIADTRVPTPTRVVSPEYFMDVAADGFHSCALAASGKLFCWGLNQFGQVGNTTAPYRVYAPVEVETDARFHSVEAGYYHTCGVDYSGALYCWGGNFYGQLGIGSTVYKSPVPVEVWPGQAFRDVSASFLHTLAVTDGGLGYSWGWNVVGQLGMGSVGGIYDAPVPIVGVSDFAQISGGTYHSCGLSQYGALYCWGANQYGQLGLGIDVVGNFPSPQLNPTHDFLSISAGAYGTCGITSYSVEPLCWGANYRGQLVLGGDSVLYEPVPGLVTTP